MNLKKSLIVSAILGLMAGITSKVAAQEALVGAWALKLTNTTYNVKFEDLRTYHAGGTITEVQNSLPTMSQSPGHGVWMGQSNDYNATFLVFEFDTTKQHIGAVRVREAIRLIGQDSISVRWKADFILLNGNVIPNVAEGIGSGTRIRVQMLTAINETNLEAPSSFELLPNYPNPFNPSTTIRYSVPKTTFVNLQVLDALGRQVRTLVDREVAAGGYVTQWDGKNNQQQPVPSGSYFLRMNAGGYVSSKKMTLIK